MTEYDPTIYDPDPRPDEAPIQGEGGNIAIIRTSDRMSFRRCRRRWAWSSHLRQNLGPIVTPAPLWLGTGFHFALEDYHGYRTYEHSYQALMAYCEATFAKARHKIPVDAREQAALALKMLHYYEHFWLPSRTALESTFFWKGIPQCEVNFKIEVPWPKGKYGFDKVYYSGTLDRVIIDDKGRLWIVEYKTAKALQTLHFANDSQISVYVWAGNCLYDRPIEGVIYVQFKKDLAQPPRVLSNGQVSTDRHMPTTRALYKKTLLSIYGTIEKCPIANVDHLNWLSGQEDWERGDKFVRRDKVHRNDFQSGAEGAKILMEIDEMLNPNLPLYPNPTRDCPYLCPFSSPCVTMDDGGDWEYELSLLTEERERTYDLWRKFLPAREVISQPEMQALSPLQELQPPQLLPNRLLLQSTQQKALTP